MSIRQTLLYAFCLFFLATGFAHAALVTVEDSYGIPVSRLLQVEAFGVLDNDTLDGLNAGESGVTATLHTGVTKGTLSCPGSDPETFICDDGSFEYTPGPGFDGFDSFQYQAVSISETSPPTTVNISACSGGPTVYICWHEASYLATLSELGYNNAFVESFEGVAWDVARSPITAPSILSNGITWTTNHPGITEITTGIGPARTGAWGVYDSNHGFGTGNTGECAGENPPLHCFTHDGFSGSMPGPDLYGVGGYISGDFGANVDIILDGIPHNIGPVPVTGHHFMGVINTAGFNAFEYRELEGTIEQLLYIFGDDFTIATSATLEGSVQFGAPTYTVAEDGVTATINVTRTDAIGDFGAASVDYAIADGTANAGSDYTAVATGTVSFAAGDATDKSISISIIDGPGSYEGDETVNLALSNATGAALGTPATATLTITENDPLPIEGSVQFEMASYTVAEDGVTATINVTRTGASGDFGAASVDYVIADGTANAGSDYTAAATGTVSFAAGDAVTKSISITIINSPLIYEGDETVDLSLSNATGASLGAPSSAVLTITENNLPPPAGTLQFDMAGYTVAEDGVTATINVTRTGGSFGAASVDYTITDGSANAGSDYTAANGTVSFAAGDVVTKSISISIINSPLIYEGDETVNLALSNATGATLGAPASAVLTITENDPIPLEGSVQFGAPTYTVTEAGVTALINVTRTGTSGDFGAASVDYAITDGTASAGSDYTAVATGTVSFAAGDAADKSISISIIDSPGTYEGDETVDLTLSNATGAILGTPATATLTITENDPVPLEGSVQFGAPTYTVAEDGVTTTINVTRTGASGDFGAASVDYTITDGTANAGSDYTAAATGTVSFAAGDAADKSISITIINSPLIYEGDETVNLALSNATGAALGTPSSSVLTITENDLPPPAGTLQFDMAGYTVAEDGVTATINVTRSGGSFGMASADYTITDGSANAGSDYTATNGTVNFADGDTLTKSFSISIINSPGTYEGDETVNLALSNVTGAALGTPATATLTITENDPLPIEGSVQFGAPTYTVTEAGVTALINVTRTGASGDFGAASVDYTITDGTANAGSDYTATNGTINFAAGDVATKSFSIGIIDGPGTYEGDETVNLALSNATGASLGTPAAATLTITENDPIPSEGSVQFGAPTYTVTEAGVTALINVTRTGASGDFGAASVDYTITDGSANAGSDYTATNGTVTFAAGDAADKNISISIINNPGIYEGDETVNLALSNATGATLGAPASAVLTITENDPVPVEGTLQFGAPTYTVAENGITAMINVTRTGASGDFGAASVDYTITDGTANAGSDYTATNGTINFAAGDATDKSISISIVDSPNIYEGDETVNLALSNATGATLGTPSSAILTITENDPVPLEGSMQFGAPTYTVTEAGVTALINVTRTGASGDFGAASVDYVIADGTASAGSDYTAAATGTVSFVAGDAADKNISITIINSPLIYEGDETVNLALSNATGASLGTPATATLTITENDPVPVGGTLQFGAPTYTVAENGITAMINVTRTGASGDFGAASVDYVIADGTANAGSDYTAAATGTVNFAVGDAADKNISISIVDSPGTYEGDETVDLSLSNATGATLGAPAAATLTITEIDPVPSEGSVQFGAPTYTVTEAGLSALINVTRTGASGDFGAASVDYTITDGSANAGSDYTAAATGTVNFAVGDAADKNISISIVDSPGTYEGDETVDLSLSNATGATLGAPAAATLTITENDPLPIEGSVQFEMASYSVAENGVTATINVTRTGASGDFGAASVDYAITDGSANAGSDYTATNGTINFAAGDATDKSISISIVDSPNIYEGDETVNLSLSNASGATLGAPSSAVLTITENDPIPPAGTLQFEMASYTVAEDGVTATINVTRSGGSFGTASADYTITDGSANAGSDYTAANGTVSFAAGDAVTKSFSISIIDSPGTYEGDETVNLALSNVIGATLGAPASAVLTITENDPVPLEGSVQFGAPTYTVTEAGVTALINVTRTGTSGDFGAASVDYVITDGTANAGSDYTAVNGTINFAAGDATDKSISISIVDSPNIYEGDETVNLALSNATGAALGAPTSAVLTITENDPVPVEGTLQFEMASYTVAENGVTETINVTRTGASGDFGAASVDYTITDGSANAGSDYTATNGTVSFAAGDAATKSFSISIIDGAGTYEGDETVNLNLSNATGAALGTPATATLTITENDPLPIEGSVQFEMASYTVAEDGVTATINVTRTGASGDFGAASVDYVITDGSANAGSDYTAANGTINFAAGDVVTKSFSISIIDGPLIYEGDETVNLALSNATGASLGAPASAVLTITENDPVPLEGSVQFEMASYSVAEDGVTATINVTRTGASGDFGTASVDYVITDGTANAGSDYTAVNGTVNFAAGDAADKNISISIVDNPGTYEGDETVNLGLSNASGATLGAPASTVLTITENDPVPPAGSLQFGAPSYTVAENGITATITVTRIGGSFGNVGVDYASADGSADGGDYTAVNGTLSFADGELTKTFTVPILDDVVYEGDETMNLSLSFPTGDASLGSPDTAILTITEDEPVPPAGSLQFSAPIYTVAESGTTATITVTRIGGSFGSVGVDYASADGSADGGDYTAVNGTLSFANGEVTKTFTIDIFDDADYEGDETISLMLSNPTGGAGLDSPAAAVLTIMEDEPVPLAGSLQFSAPIYTVAENVTTATITVTRVGGSFGSVGVDFASSDVTASAGSDYTAVIGSLNFADGEVSQSFSIDILDDVDYEGDETISLMLSNPTGGAGLDSPSTAVLTITEDEPASPAGSLQFSAAIYIVSENVTTATITVTRLGGSTGSVGVDFASSDGTATAGSDYMPVIGSLSFADGEVSHSFSIDILNDFEYEGNETVILALSNPSGGAGLDSPAAAVLTINEDDGVPQSGSLQFSEERYKVNEYETAATITVTRVGGSSGDVSVDYATSDSTATAGSDYKAVSGTLNFADGETSQSFSINILQDTETEVNESLKIILSNPTGGAGLGSPSTASLKIIEKETIFGDSSSGSIDLITLMLLFSFYLRNFRKKTICKN